MGGANRKMKRQRPDSTWSIYEVLNPFQNRKTWTFSSRTHSPNFWVYHGGSWRMSNCHIQKLKKWIFLRCLILKEFIFPKGLGNVPPLFAQPNCEDKSFEPDHQILSQCPIQRFLTLITSFLGASSQKEDDFSRIINQVLKIFFRHRGSPILKIKRIFE